MASIIFTLITLLLLAIIFPIAYSWKEGLKFSSTASDISSPFPPLSSCFPIDVPIGLRREAIASALTSRGICVNFSEMNAGVVHVKGRGCLEFLNSKLSNSFPSPSRDEIDRVGLVREACILTPRGRVVDKLIVPYWTTQKGLEMEALLITSPDPYLHQKRRSSTDSHCYLYQKLSPLVFPLDQITISDCTATSTVLALACTDIKILNDVIIKTLSPLIADTNSLQRKATASNLLPKPGSAIKIELNFDTERDPSVIIASGSFLPNSVGYIMVINNDLQNQIRDAFCDQGGEDDEFIGALPIQALDYETLRIDLCLPGVGREITGDDDFLADGLTPAAKVGPLELGLRHTVDVAKGCYLGQEGVSALLKNPRGLPRTIYQVFFDDVTHDPSEVSGSIDTIGTLCPKPGDTLFVLGSNEAIKAGVLTSVLQPDDPPQYYDEEEGVSTVAIALIRRPDYIIEKMEKMGLDSIGDTIDPNEFCEEAPLHGLEVIVGGINAIGRLRAVSVVRNEMQQEYSPVSDEPSTVMGFIPTADSDFMEDLPKKSSMSKEEMELQLAMEEAEKAKKAAEAAATEAKRAEEKLKDMQSRAEAALAARQQYSQRQSQPTDDETTSIDEAKRKQEKIAMLKARAEAAMEARRKKKEKSANNEDISR